jgi:hypothetical protein
MELNVIIKIRKYKGLHKGAPLYFDGHGGARHTLEHYMHHFIKDCARLFHDKQLRSHLSLSFYIQFFKQHVSIAFQHTLTFAIKKKIVLVGDVCSRPPLLLDLTICIQVTLKGPWVK